VSGIGLHEDITRKEEVQAASDRTFGLIFGAAFIVIPLIVWWRGGSLALWPFGIGIVFLLLAAFRPTLLTPLNRLWRHFGVLLARVTNPLLMGFVFFGVVTPMGFAMRLVGKRPLHLGFEPGRKSYWIERSPPGPAPDSMTNQF